MVVNVGTKVCVPMYVCVSILFKLVLFEIALFCVLCLLALVSYLLKLILVNEYVPSRYVICCIIFFNIVKGVNIV